MWRKGTSDILGALGCRFGPQPSTAELRIQCWCWCSCGLGCNCSSDLTPGLGAPNAMGWPKKKKKGEDKGYGEDRELVKYGCSRVTWFCF